MKKFKIFPILLLLVITLNNCSTEEEIPVADLEEFGFLALNIALEIEELSTSSRVTEVNTDNFIVTIHKAEDGSEVMRFDPFSDAPTEIQLPTGEYFVRATNLEPPASAEFEQPWYFGESEIFNIDKEELKTVDVNCTLANYKVSFVFSQNVIDNFSLWNATATRTSDDAGLFWFEDLLPAEGYFTTGSPLDISVYLEYTKVFTGDLITRTFETAINDPQPATHYRINIDASLEDGIIVLNINVDDSFVVIDIDLGDNDGNGNWIPGESWQDDRNGQNYETIEIGDLVWMKSNLNFDVEGGTYDFGLGTEYGLFYTYEAMLNGDSPNSDTDPNPSQIQGVCPVGWHLPSVQEVISIAEIYQPNFQNYGPVSWPDAGGAMKLPGIDEWSDPNTGGTNESGFSALPAGQLYTNESTPRYVGESAIWWTSELDEDDSEYQRYFRLLYNYGELNAGRIRSANTALTVRCVKDY